ncbi:MAG: hypothetical protein CVV33_06565 [Methanomicrobiales archaeon HGW-Methanomicrobiales-4]|nr:MAG: hypothetical protein CVV33_06565 [Methanomicrobiales archaeon HGW-Methanomicrobiales-4]
MSGDIIDSAFLEWTSGLPLQEQLISIFLHIRDIPYALVPSLGNQMSGPEQLLYIGKGSCGPKHHLLGSLFTRLGIPVRYQLWPFLWNDPELLFPPDLRASAAGLGITSHLACLAFLNEKWVLVDATWDLSLEKGGFPVNQSWDGRSDTLLAVHPVNREDHPGFFNTPVPRSRNVKTGKAGRGEFVDLFNAWLDQVRYRA